MKQSRFFAVKSNSAKKLRNFIRLVKRMGIDYNHDWMNIDVLDDYPRQNSGYALGFSNHWSGQNNNGFTCAMTPSGGDLIDIDTKDGYIDAVKRVLQEIEYIGTQVFSDINGTELKVGDQVVMIDNEGLVQEDNGDFPVFNIGELLIVEKLVDLDPNYITFVSQKSGLMNGFYGHRVAKLIR
jgi:hypothetical protein